MHHFSEQWDLCDGQCCFWQVLEQYKVTLHWPQTCSFTSLFSAFEQDGLQHDLNSSGRPLFGIATFIAFKYSLESSPNCILHLIANRQLHFLNRLFREFSKSKLWSCFISDLLVLNNILEINSQAFSDISSAPGKSKLIRDTRASISSFSLIHNLRICLRCKAC